MDMNLYEISDGIQGRQLMIGEQRVVFLSEKEASKVPQLNGSANDYVQFVGQVGSFVVYNQVGSGINSVTVHTPKRLPRTVPYSRFAREINLSFPEGLELEHALLREE